jgi:Major Facilitator Superfamily
MTGELHEEDIPDAGINPPPRNPANVDLEKAVTIQSNADLDRVQSHISHHDIHAAASTHPSSHIEVNAAQYERFTPHRKVLITIVLSVCSFLAPISSTTILSAIPEVAATFNTTGTIINVSNALYLIFMGLSPCFWGPLSSVYGRRSICVASALLFTAFSIGTSLAPNLASYFIFRMLTAFQGTSFLIVGTSCLGEFSISCDLHNPLRYLRLILVLTLALALTLFLDAPTHTHIQSSYKH